MRIFVATRMYPSTLRKRKYTDVSSHRSCNGMQNDLKTFPLRVAEHELDADEARISLHFYNGKLPGYSKRNIPFQRYVVRKTVSVVDTQFA